MSIPTLRKRFAKIGRYYKRAVRDRLRDHVSNLCRVRGDRRICLMRHRASNYYRHLLGWVAKEIPEVRHHMELSVLSRPIRDCSQYALLVPWINEVYLHFRRPVLERALAVEERFRQHGVPVVNPAKQVLNADKYSSARILAETGIRTPEMAIIEDVDHFRQDLAGMQPPILVRNRLGHAGITPMFLIEQHDDVHKFPLERLRSPVAAEFIDVSDSNGYCRKYRYLMAGRVGVSRSLQISTNWEVRGGWAGRRQMKRLGDKAEACEKTRLAKEITCEEEVAFVEAPDPNHERFQRAGKALGLEFLAFDYSYDQDGNLVVWEVNVTPGMKAPPDSEARYRFLARDRAVGAMIKLYLDRAGIEVPRKIHDMLTVGTAGIE